MLPCPHTNGAVTYVHGTRLPGLFVTGWIKRGSVGLIGSSKSDPRQTIETLLDHTIGTGHARGSGAIDGILRERGRRCIDWDGWLRIDSAEQQFGAARGRDRIKIADRTELTDIGLPQSSGGDVAHATPHLRR